MSIPGSALPLLLASSAGAAGGYEIERSVRFNSADSAYLNRTPASSGDRRTFTISCWVKRSKLGSYPVFFSAGNQSADVGYLQMSFENDIFQIYINGGATFTDQAKYRDPSAWYSFILAVDTTSGTPSDRLKAYVNGTPVAWNSTPTIPQDFYTLVNKAGDPQQIGAGKNSSGTTNVFYDGYLADFYLIDGQALDPTDFGEFDDNGVWQPIEYAGTYGTNGFHLPFNDNSSASALGTDDSGNGNDWTVNNLSVTAGIGNDSLRDSPTNGDTANDTGAGGEIPGNYCTMNPLDADNLTLSNGNLGIAATGGFGIPRAGTIAASSGKWYWEFEVVTATTSFGPGWGFSSTDKSVYALQRANSTNVRSAGCTVNSTNPGNITSGTVGVALDIDAGTATIYHNNSSVATVSGIPAGTYTLAYTADSATDVSNLNAGQRAFTYTAPSGYKALCTASFPDPTIAIGSTAMDVVLYTGNGSSQTISGLEFSPDLVWVKKRSANGDNVIYDSVRGATNQLVVNGDDSTVEAQGLTAFNSDGFSVGSSATLNENSSTFVGWAWDENVSAGLDIVTYTGNGTSGNTVAHSLGVKPSLIIVKRLESSNDWALYHTSLGATKVIKFNSINGAQTASNQWNDTEPTSTVFTLGDGGNTNSNGVDYVAYCFAPVEGYSAFGSFVSNGAANNVFVFTGFKPRFILYKRSDGSGYWGLRDTARDTENPDTLYLQAQNNLAEQTGDDLDVLSNGFKVRSSNFSSSNTYIYYAVAETPFKYARAR